MIRLSEKYTTTLKKEIDLYIENLHNFQKFDIGILDEAYNKYIDCVNSRVCEQDILALVKSIESIKQKHDEIIELQAEGNKELETLENQLREFENKDNPIKKRINSLKKKINTEKTELEKANRLMNDPFRRMLGYKAKYTQEIARLESAIKLYEGEIEVLEQQRYCNEIKKVKSEIAAVKSRIKKTTSTRSAFIDKNGNKINIELRLAGITSWFVAEFTQQRLKWLDNSPEYKKILSRVDLLDVSGYSFINYKNLFEILFAYPGATDSDKIKLDEKFSVLCQEKFSSLKSICPKNNAEKSVWEDICARKIELAFTDIIFPTEPRKIENDHFEKYLYKEDEARKEFLVTQDDTICYLEAKRYATQELLRVRYINEDILLKIKTLITENPEMDLPEIIIALREDEMEYYEIASELLSFQNLYRETDEQILKTNQQIFAEREILRLEENARQEREMYEQQAELERQAANARASIMASAERERAAAERERAAVEIRKVESMVRQARLEREAAEQRAASERRDAERHQREADEIARQSHSDEIWRARRRCLQCARRGVCHNKEVPNCAAFIPQ